ncbi:UBC-like protein [Schizopora paradoxa]|uniref:UBC-like protein n=1 Tax=Schizopora paradoxa TaxID=27342 RepID=A0A0H2RWU5_9AGAM|nr:UBC-like protein [Schizopora paradoxa]
MSSKPLSKPSVPSNAQSSSKVITSVSTAPEPSFLAQAELSMEYASLQNKDHLPLGMVVLPSPKSMLLWEGVLFVHQGYYADAVLKFHITFTEDYPNQMPTVKFLTDIFHPLVSQEDGILNMIPRFSPWRPKQDHVFDVLHFIKLAFKKQMLDNVKESDCLNKEAYKYREATASFAGLATQAASLSNSGPALFDSSNHTQANSAKNSKSGPQTSDVFFHEVKEEEIVAMQDRLGLKAW